MSSLIQDSLTKPVYCPQVPNVATLLLQPPNQLTTSTSPSLVVVESALEKSLDQLCQWEIVDQTGRLASHIDQTTLIPTIAVKQTVGVFLAENISHTKGLNTVLQLLLSEKKHALKLRQPIQAFRITGELVGYLLRHMLPELFKARFGEKAAELLCSPAIWEKITQKPQHWNICSETPHTTITQLKTRLQAVANKEIPLFAKGPAAAPFDKCKANFYAHANDLTCHEKLYKDYLCVEIGQLSYCLASQAKDSSLFESDDLQILIAADSLTQEMSQLEIKLVSEGGCGLQALLDRIFKIMRLSNPTAADYMGAVAWQAAIVKGAVPLTYSEYNVLPAKLLQEYTVGKWNEIYLATLLQHYPQGYKSDNSPLLQATLALQFKFSSVSQVQKTSAVNSPRLPGHQLEQFLPTQLLAGEPLIALQAIYHLTTAQLTALLSVGALLKLGLPVGCGQSAYAIELKSIDSRPFVRYTLGAECHLLIPLDLQGIEDILQDPSLYSIVDDKALCTFFTHCYTSYTITGGVAVTSSVLERYACLKNYLINQQIQEYAEKCLAREGFLFQMMGTALLVGLAAVQNKEAEKTLLCKTLPWMFSQGESELARWSKDITTAILLHRVSPNQYVCVQDALAMTEKEVPASMAWQDAMAAAHHPLYNQWISQTYLSQSSTQAICSIIPEQQNAAWLTTYRSLAASHHEGAIAAALTKLLLNAEMLTLPLEISALLWLSKAVCCYQAADAFRLLPLWSYALKAEPRPLLDEAAMKMLLECCQNHLKTEKLPILTLLAPIVTCCQCFSVDDIRSSPLYRPLVHTVLIPAIESLLSNKKDGAVISLCQQLAAYIDPAVIEEEEHLVWRELIAYLAEKETTANQASRYALMLAQEQIACENYSAAINTIFTLAQGPLSTDDTATLTDVAKKLLCIALNDQFLMQKSWPLLMLPILSKSILDTLRSYKNNATALFLCQLLLRHHQFKAALKIAKTLKYETAHASSRLTRRYLLRQLAYASQITASTAVITAAGKAIKALQLHGDLDTAVSISQASDHRDALQLLQTAQRQIRLSWPLLTKTKWRLQRHLRHCFVHLLKCLLQQAPCPIKLTLAQEILLGRYSSPLLGEKIWSEYTHQWLEKVHMSAVLALQEILPAFLAHPYVAYISPTTTLLCCQCLRACIEANQPPSVMSKHALEKGIPKLIARLNPQQVAHRQALLDILLWSDHSKATLHLALSDQVCLLQAAIIGIQTESSWLEYASTPRQLQQHVNLQTTLQKQEYSSAYMQLVRLLWDTTHSLPSLKSWLQPLEHVFTLQLEHTEEILADLLDILFLLQEQADQLHFTWGWVQLLKIRVSGPQLTQWQALARAGLQAAWQQNNILLCAQGLASDFDLGFDRQLQNVWASRLPELIQPFLIYKKHAGMLTALIDCMAKNLNLTGWHKLWCILAKNAFKEHIEQAYSIWSQCKSELYHINISLTNQITHYCLLALAKKRSTYCLCYLNQTKLVSTLLSNSNCDAKQRLDLGLLLFEIASSLPLSKNIAEDLYHELLKIPSTAKEQLAVLETCFEKVCHQHTWPLVASILNSNFVSPTPATAEQKNSLLKIALAHVSEWPLNSEITTSALLHMLKGKKEQIIANKAVCPAIYRWLLQVEIAMPCVSAATDTTVELLLQIRDQITLSLLVSLSQSTPEVVCENLILVQQLLDRTIAQTDVPNDWLIKFTHLQSRNIKSPLWPAMMQQVAMYAHLNQAFESDDMQKRVIALDQFIVQFPKFTPSPSTVVYAERSLDVLVALLSRDRQPDIFDIYYLKLFACFCSGFANHTQTPSCTDITEPSVRYCNYFSYLLESVACLYSNNLAIQLTQAKCLLTTLLNILKHYVEKFTPLKPAEVLRLIHLVYFHPCSNQTPLLTIYKEFLPQIQVYLAQTDLIEEPDWQLLQLYVSLFSDEPLPLDTKQLTTATCSLVNLIIYHYPHLYQHAIQVTTNLLKIDSSVDEEMAHYKCCLQLIENNETGLTGDQFEEHFERYNAIFKTLICKGKVFGAGWQNEQLFVARSLHMYYFEGFFNAFNNYWRAIITELDLPTLEIKFKFYFERASIYLQILNRNGIFKVIAENTLTLLWASYSGNVKLLRLLLLKEAAFLSTPTKISLLTHLHTLIKNPNFSENLADKAELLHLRQQFYMDTLTLLKPAQWAEERQHWIALKGFL